MELVRMIPVSRIREPERAARTEIDDEALSQLAESIRALGVLEPLIVRALDDGSFETVAGHRRLLASRLVGLAEVPCSVEVDDSRVDAIKIHENIAREELSPSDEAVFYAELYERLGEDVDKVAETVRKKRDYVERRLNLLRGDPLILEALRKGQISVGVAEEFNKMSRAEDRSYYLDYGVRAGVTIRLARTWREEANTRAGLMEASKPPALAGSAPGDGAGAPGPPGPSYAGMAKPYELSSSTETAECFFCGSTHQQWQMYRKFQCSPCADAWARRMVSEGR